MVWPFARSRHRAAAHAVYAALVAQARDPAFYALHGVPDTLDGRFEMISLHLFLVLRRLKGDPAAEEFAQALFDLMFADMDRGLREMGTGDLGVGRQVKRMAQAFYGRVAAYEAGLAAEAPDLLEEALRRNLYGTIEPAAAGVRFMIDYARRVAAVLAVQAVPDIVAGRLAFEPVGPSEEA